MESESRTAHDLTPLERFAVRFGFYLLTGSVVASIALLCFGRFEQAGAVFFMGLFWSFMYGWWAYNGVAQRVERDRATERPSVSD